MYDELINSLRELCEMTALCEDYSCFECPYEEKCSNYKNGRLSTVYGQAADAINGLMAFARFVAEEVVVDDNEWGNNQNTFPEIACRKLFKLGIVSKIDDEMWHYEPPKGE